MGWVPGPDGYPVYQEDAPAFPNPLDVLGVQTARQAIAMPPSPSEFPGIRQPTTSLAEVERDFQRLPSWAQDALETFYSPLGVVNKPFALTRQYAERAAPISAASPPLPEGAQLPSSLPSLAQMDEEFRSLPEWVQEAFKLALDPTNTLMNLPVVTSAAVKGTQLAARQVPKIAKRVAPIARELAVAEAGTLGRRPPKQGPAVPMTLDESIQYAEEMRSLEQPIYEAEREIAAYREEWQSNPLASYVLRKEPLFATTTEVIDGVPVMSQKVTNRSKGLTSLIRTSGEFKGEIPETIPVSEATAILERRPRPQSLTPDGQRAYTRDVIDEISSSLGFKHSDDFFKAVKSLAAERATVAELEAQVARDTARYHQLDDLLNRAVSKEQPLTTGPAMQAGMNIGERPPQGELIPEFLGEGQKGQLADAEQLAARQARQAEIAKGQSQLPEATAPPIPEEIVPGRAPVAPVAEVTPELAAKVGQWRDTQRAWEDALQAAFDRLPAAMSAEAKALRAGSDPLVRQAAAARRVASDAVKPELIALAQSSGIKVFRRLAVESVLDTLERNGIKFGEAIPQVSARVGKVPPIPEGVVPERPIEGPITAELPRETVAAMPPRPAWVTRETQLGDASFRKAADLRERAFTRLELARQRIKDAPAGGELKTTFGNPSPKALKRLAELEADYNAKRDWHEWVKKARETRRQGEPPTPERPPVEPAAIPQQLGRPAPGRLPLSEPPPLTIPPAGEPVPEGLLPLGGGLEPPNLPPGGIPVGQWQPPQPGYKRRVFIPKPIQQVVDETPRGLEVGKTAARVPGVRAGLEVFNPSALDDTPLRYGLRAHQRQTDVIDGVAGRWGAPLAARADPFIMDSRGLVTNIAIVDKAKWKDGIHKLDLRGAVARGEVKLNPEQADYLRLFSELQDDTTTLARAENVLTPKQILENYSKRIVTGRQEGVLERLTGSSRRKLGGKMGFQKARDYNTATEGVLRGGLLYETDLAKVASKSHLDTLRATEEKRLADYIKQLPQARRGGPVNLGMARVTAPGLRVAMGFTKTGKPKMRSLVMPAEDVNAIAKVLDDMGIPQLVPLQTATGVARFMRTGWDLGTSLLQGLPVLLRRPDAWARAEKLSLQALRDPKVRARWLTENWDEITQYASEGVHFGSTEFTDLISPLTRLPGAGEAAKRAEASFNIFGDAARFYWRRSLQSLAAESPVMAEKVASLINKGTGWMSFNISGMPKAMQQILSIGLFAPRYTASTLALTYGIVSGTIPRVEGLKLLGSMLVIAPLAYSAISLALGQAPELDPRSSKFMTWAIGEHRVGIGSTWVSLARFAGNIAKDVGGVAELDGDNPLVRFARSKLGPYPQIATDLITGRNYVGDPVEGWGGLLKGLAEAHMPFWASSFVFETQDAIAPLSEIGGLREFPISAGEKTQNLQSVLSGGQWDNLSPNEQKSLERQNPQLRQLAAQAAADQAGRGSDYAERKLAQWQFEDARDNALTNAANALTSKRIRGEDFIKIYNDAVGTYANQTQGLWATYPGKTATDANDIALSAYMSVPLNRNPITMEFDFNAYDAQKQAVLAGLPSEQRKYVETNQAAYPDKFPVAVAPWVRKWMNDKVLLKMYWSVADKYWGRVPGLKQVSDQIDQIPDPNQRTAMRNGMPQIRQTENMINQERLRLRLKNPALDKAVLFWTSATTPALMAR